MSYVYAQEGLAMILFVGGWAALLGASVVRIMFLKTR